MHDNANVMTVAKTTMRAEQSAGDGSMTNMTAEAIVTADNPLIMQVNGILPVFMAGLCRK